MSFIEIKRYHIQCDRQTCGNLFTAFDLTDGDDDEGISIEVEKPEYTGALCNALSDAGWKFIGTSVYCAECIPFSAEESLFTFLKADMGIV